MKLIRGAVAFAACALVALPAFGVAQGSSLTADLRSGACDAPGEAVATLGSPVAPQGQPVGAAGGVTAVTSYSEVALSLETLLATEQSLAIADGGTVVACAPLGGVRGPDGSLAVVIEERDDSGVSGVAFLAPAGDPASTAISLFLNPGDASPGPSAAEQTADVAAEADQAASTAEAPATETPAAQRQPQGDLGLTYLGPGPRSNEYARFEVVLRNNTNEDIQNPQTGIVVELGGEEWSCQGYYDPISGVPVSGVFDVLGSPLVIPAGEEIPVTILCRIPEVPMETAQVRLR